MTETTPGREPIQLVEFVQPLCGNICGTAPCTAAATPDVKCYNTRATCLDEANFRGRPWGHLTSDEQWEPNDTVDVSELATTEDVFLVTHVVFDSAPEGVILDAGGTSNAVYIGVNSSDNLVIRFGDSSATDPAACAKIETAVSPFAGRELYLMIEFDISTDTVTAWAYDPTTREVEAVGSDTAASTITTWAGTTDGTIGAASGATPSGESAVDWTGKVYWVRFYNSQTAPDMTAAFKLSLFFSRGNVGEQFVEGAPYIIPSLNSVSTVPATINLAAADPNVSGIGSRALCSITLNDHPHTDRLVDPYLSGRSFNPMERGSFWTKWMARNKYRSNMKIVIYEGFVGQTLSEMRSREYFMEEISGPGDGGQITVKGKDIMARVEERKAQAPLASPGELAANITNSATSLTVTGALISDYDDAGYLCIDDEIIQYTGVSGTTTLTFSGLTRGVSTSVAAAHTAGDQVQQVLHYNAQTVDVILADLMETYAGIPATYLDKANWRSEADQYLSAYTLTTYITAPTAVKDLVSEIQEQALCMTWWDEYAKLIKFRVIRGLKDVPLLLTEENHILAGSFSFSEAPKQRVSQVWLYHNPREWTKTGNDENAWTYLRVAADLESEGFDKYDEKSVRKIFSRWLPTQVLAAATANKILVRYKENPTMCTFRLDAKDRELINLGQTVRIRHHTQVNAYGLREQRYWTITSKEEIVAGEIVEYTAEDTSLWGRIYFIQAAGAADYVTTDDDYNIGFIGDTDGKLSDGTDSARMT